MGSEYSSADAGGAQASRAIIVISARTASDKRGYDSRAKQDFRNGVSTPVSNNGSPTPNLGTFVIAVIFGVITAAVAKKKGRNMFVWFFFGAVIFILALPAALLMKPIEPEY